MIMIRPRAREFGVKLGRLQPGRFNAITDVEGVGVGHVTLVEGDSVRTGVTAIVPHQDDVYIRKVTAAVDLFNPYGKATGFPQIMSEGVIETPIMLTETMNTWHVANAVLEYCSQERGYRVGSLNPVVGETNGGYLTDNLNRRIGNDEVFEAIKKATNPRGCGSVEEGNVGGGTPMTGYGFKGGIGTASRIAGEATVGVLVQLNCGEKEDLTIAGVPVGREIEMPEPEPSLGNSVMMIVATDVILNSRQLTKVAKRAILGLARTGTFVRNGSGDFTVAFTTDAKSPEEAFSKPVQGDEFLNVLYQAVVEATEESVVNALFKSETMIGYQGHRRFELPLDQVREIFGRYGRPLC
jgi:D-aminopeptidase